MVLPLILGTIGSIIGGGTALGATGAALGYAAGTLLAMILKPMKGPNVQGPRLDDLTIQTSSTAAKLARAYGTVAHRGNMIWAKGNTLTEVSNTTTKKKKVLGFTVAKQTTTTFEYFLTCAVAFCKVPANSELRVVRVWVGDNLVINNSSADVGTVLVGGGNAAQYFNFYYGTDDQQPDPLIAEDLGADLASGYPGIFYVVMKDFPLKDYLNSVSRAELKIEYTLSFTESGMTHVLDVPLPPGADSYDELIANTNANFLDTGGLHVWRVGPFADDEYETMFNRAEILLTPGSTIGVPIRTVTGITPGFSESDDTIISVPYAAKGVADRNVQVFTSVLMRTAGGGDGGASYPDPRLMTGLTKLEFHGGGWGVADAALDAIEGTPAAYAPVSGSAGGWYYNNFNDAMASIRHFTGGPGQLDSQPTFDIYSFQSGTQDHPSPSAITWYDNPVTHSGARYSIIVQGDLPVPLPFPLEQSSADGSNFFAWINVEIWDADQSASTTARIDITGSNPTPNPETRFSYRNGVAYVTYSQGVPVEATSIVKIEGGRVTERGAANNVLVSAFGIMGDEVVIITNDGTDAIMYRYDLDLNIVQSYNSAQVAALFGESDSTFFNNVSVQFDGIYFVLDGDMQYLPDFAGSPVTLGDVSSTIILGTSAEGFFDIKSTGSLIAVSTFGDTLPNMGAQFYSLGLVNPQKVGLDSIISAECQLAGLATNEIDVSDLTAEVRGIYIASGGSVRNVIQQLQAAFPFDVIPSGYKLKFIPRGQSSVMTATWEDLGPDVSWTQQREMDSQLPRKVTLKYFDPAVEYEVNSQPSERPIDSKTESVVEIPVVMNADEAAQAVDVLHSVYLVERVEYGPFTLPPTFRALEPADVLTVELQDATYEVRLESVQYRPDGSLQCTGVPNAVPIYTSNAVGQAPAPLPDTIAMAGPIFTVLLDIPAINEGQDDPGFTIAMSGIYENWGGGVLWETTDQGQTWAAAQGFSESATIGTAASDTLGEHGCHLPALGSTLTVQLYTGTLTSVSDEGFYNEELLVAYGVDDRWEIMAVKTATDNGNGNYTLSTFLRGLRGTEWTTGLHQAGDYVVLLDYATLTFLGLTTEAINTILTYRAASTGASINNVPDLTLSYNAANLRPLSGVHPLMLQDDDEDLHVTWIRRGRIEGGWDDMQDVPLGEETEAYEIDILDTLGGEVLRTIETTLPEFSYTAAQQIADFGATQLTLPVAIYQMSAEAGRGFPLTAVLPISYVGAPVDNFWSMVVLMLGFEGVDGSTTLTDESSAPHALVANGNAQIDTAQFKYGFASGLFDGAGDFWAAADSPDWDLETGDFTVECFVRPAAIGSRMMLFGQGDNGASNVRNGMEITAAGKIRYVTGAFPAGTQIALLGTTTMVANTWYHVAATRIDMGGGTVTWRLFLNGVQEATTNSSSAFTGLTNAFSIGRLGEFAGLYMNGHIDELRITKGRARYTAAFTPPVRAFPRSGP